MRETSARTESGRTPTDVDTSRALDGRLSDLIPGGAHTYAKGSDQYPEGMAPVVSHGAGCRVWDIEGNEFIEWGMGLRAVTLGHGYAPVAEAVARQAYLGTNFVRPSALELEAAEAFLNAVRGPEMVKFTKDGSTANTAAVKLARAFTGRPLVAIAGDQPFFSYDDWAMVATPLRAGIPPGVDDLTLTFRYNDLDSVERLFAEHEDRIACVVLEAERTEPPRDGFLEKLRAVCSRHGALLVFDENVTGFRWHIGGAQAVHGVQPDLSTWGKGMANGFALSALAGKREVMELGGLEHDRERVFLLSTTHGAEHTALAAAVATIGVYQSEPVIEELYRRGERLRKGLGEAATARGVGEYFQVFGKAPCLFYGTRDAEHQPSQAYRTLFLQETVGRGLLAPSLVISYSHQDADVDRTIEIVDASLEVYAQALETGVDRFLRGRPVQPVYRRFNRP